jgi:hypothetical protein
MVCKRPLVVKRGSNAPSLKGYKMTFDERVFKAAQRIVDNPWFLGCFMGCFFGYIIYSGVGL